MLSAEATKLVAAAILALAGLATLGYFVAMYRRYNFSLIQFPIYMLNMLYARIVWRTKVEGSVPLRGNQGGVIVCNHLGPIDPAFVALACDRPVHWMVAREYCDSLLFGWALRILGAIPVNRGGVDTASTRTAVRYASRGDLVGMFPEGRINDTGRLLRAGRPGAAHVALKARVPVVPCYLSGSPNDGTPWGFLLMAARVHLKVGEPIDLSEYYDAEPNGETLTLLTRRFMIEIAKLAGVDDYEPEIAGRRWKPGLAEKEAV